MAQERVGETGFFENLKNIFSYSNNKRAYLNGKREYENNKPRIDESIKLHEKYLKEAKEELAILRLWEKDPMTSPKDLIETKKYIAELSKEIATAEKLLKNNQAKKINIESKLKAVDVCLKEQAPKPATPRSIN
jgi:hypothetical protein